MPVPGVIEQDQFVPTPDSTAENVTVVSKRIETATQQEMNGRSVIWNRDRYIIGGSRIQTITPLIGFVTTLGKTKIRNPLHFSLGFDDAPLVTCTELIIQIQNGVSLFVPQTYPIQCGISRISITTIRRQIGSARIITTSGQDQFGVASVVFTSQKEQSGFSRIQGITQEVQTGLAFFQGTTEKPQTGVYNIQNTTEETQTGLSGIVITTQETQTGDCNISEYIPPLYTTRNGLAGEFLLYNGYTGMTNTA